MERAPRLFKTEQDKQEFVFWIETLRAGVLPKGKYYLQVGEADAYCCLGIAVLCTVDAGIHSLRGSIPSQAYGSPEWLESIASHAMNNYGFNILGSNDGSGLAIELTHPQIADKLWELYKWELEEDVNN
jgi:hypothetical protein